MLHGRTGGGPKPSKWKQAASSSFVAYFGKMSGAPVRPTAPVEQQEQAPSVSGSEAAFGEPEWSDGVFGVQGRYAVPDDEPVLSDADSSNSKPSASDMNQSSHVSFGPHGFELGLVNERCSRHVCVRFVCVCVWMRGFF